MGAGKTTVVAPLLAMILVRYGISTFQHETFTLFSRSFASHDDTGGRKISCYTSGASCPTGLLARRDA